MDSPHQHFFGTPTKRPPLLRAFDAPEVAPDTIFEDPDITLYSHSWKLGGRRESKLINEI